MLRYISLKDPATSQASTLSSSTSTSSSLKLVAAEEGGCSKKKKTGTRSMNGEDDSSHDENDSNQSLFGEEEHKDRRARFYNPNKPQKWHFNSFVLHSSATASLSV